MRLQLLAPLLVLVCIHSVPAQTSAPDHRSRSFGISADTILPGTEVAWSYDTGHRPSPGFYPQLRDNTLGPAALKAPTSTFDYALPLAVGHGGVYYASSTEEAIFCHDARTGTRRWSFFCEGAVRFAPVLAGDRLYFGADDGYVYCLRAADGQLVWKWTAAPEARRIIANGRMAGHWPVRTSVCLHEGILYFSTGLFPADGGVFLCALQAEDGRLVWKKNILTPAQGNIVVDGDALVVPNGRAAPAEYRLADGAPVAAVESDLRREGGAAQVSLVGDLLAYGPSEYGILRIRVSKEGQSDGGMASTANARSLRGQITGISAWRAAQQGPSVALLRWDEVCTLPAADFQKILKDSAAQSRERQKNRLVIFKSSVQQKADQEAEKQITAAICWKANIKGGRSLLVTSDQVVVGADGVVAGWELSSGKKIFEFPVDGTAWDLAAADGLLLASTDQGKLYCFGAAAEKKGVLQARNENVFSGVKPTASARLAAAVVTKAVENTGTKKGWALVLGAGDGRLAWELAQQSELQVLCVEKDPTIAQKARENLVRSGLYGSRTVVHLHPDGHLPYLQYFANVVVSEDSAAGGFEAPEAAACLRPYGGILAVPAGSEKSWGAKLTGWLAGSDPAVMMLMRGPLAGAGDWTHMFADAANTSCSGDRLVGGTQYRLQWFGDPVGQRNVGWHAGGMGPLYKDGRLFQIKVDWIDAIDAYNGALLWSVQCPGSERFNPAREGGSACVDESRLYLAVQSDCQVLDVRDGKKLTAYAVPENKGDWGYIASAGKLLLGTRQPSTATVNNQTLLGKNTNKLKSLWSASEAEFVESDLLFAVDKESGRTAWTYGGPDRAILNASITSDGERVYLVESRDPRAVADQGGSILLRQFLGAQSRLVALDLKTGRVQWEKSWNPPARSMLYLSCAEGALVASYSYHVGPLADLVTADATVKILDTIGPDKEEAKKKIAETKIRFGFERLDPACGKSLWVSEYTSSDVIGTQHNYNISHPVLAGQSIYHDPAEQYLVIVNLADGKIQERKEIARGKGCTTPTGSLRAMFYRSLGIASYDYASGRQFYVSDVSRTSCWMNVLPAGGLLLMPEYSMGCNCAFPLQTNIVLAPGSYPFEPEIKRGSKASGRGNDQ